MSELDTIPEGRVRPPRLPRDKATWALIAALLSGGWHVVREFAPEAHAAAEVTRAEFDKLLEVVTNLRIEVAALPHPKKER